ncbi:hypothetical protein [Burkholderia pseudomallei]|uniref:hypothetical protein n=1 Tax=Burkholderia pseudomallei TaxID=28450 RepID=UPI001E3D3A23|nr:hypothetical protein [Burkholderia pseudomallei]
MIDVKMNCKRALLRIDASIRRSHGRAGRSRHGDRVGRRMIARRAPLTFMGRTPWRQARDRVTAGIRPDAATTRARPRPARTRLSAAGMGDRAGSDRLATNPHQSARANRLDVADR